MSVKIYWNKRIKIVLVLFIALVISYVISISSVNLYTATTTLLVEQENVPDDVAKDLAISSSLNDELSTLRYIIVSNDFVEPHIIKELNIRLSDVYIPLARLQFVPQVIEISGALKNKVKKLLGRPVDTLTAEQKQYVQRKEISTIIKKKIQLRQTQDRLLHISYTGPNPNTCQKIVEIVANQCRDILLKSKNKEIQEALRYIERQYQAANQRLETLEQQLTDLKMEYFDTPEDKIALLKQHQDILNELRMIEPEAQVLVWKKQDLVDKQAERREAILAGTPDIIKEYLKITKPFEVEQLEAKKMRLEVLQMVYPGHRERLDVREIKAEIALREEKLHLNVKDNDIMIQQIILTDPIYNEYFHQITEIEAQQLALQIKEARLHFKNSIYEERLKNISISEKKFTDIQRQIYLFTKLQVDLATKREAARTAMQLETLRGEKQVRIISRSLPEKPLEGSPQDIVVIFWIIALCAIVAKFVYPKFSKILKEFE